MKLNPLLIVTIIFATSFTGRTIGFANAALNKSEIASEDADAMKFSADLDANESDATHKKEASTASVAHKAERDPKNGLVPSTANTEPGRVGNSVDRNAKLLAAIRERDVEIERRATEVENRIRKLEIIETRVNEKMVEIKSANEDLSKLVSLASDASKNDITLLSKMYEQMKPQKAGEIFNKMNPTFAAGFLTEMNSESAALILTNMDTDHAFQASMIIASRNAAIHN